MSIRYPVMVFSFENVPQRKGVHAGTVSLEDRELALPVIRECIEKVYMRIVQDSGEHKVNILHADVYAKLAWAYLEQFNSETSSEFRQSVQLSSRTDWALQVGVVNSDNEYMLYAHSVNVELDVKGNKTPSRTILDVPGGNSSNR